MLDQILAIALQFQQDFNTKVNVDFKARPASEMTIVEDPSGDRPAHGRCLAELDSNQGIVFINEDHWKQINKWQKKELVYHELAHCVFSLGHTQKEERIMNPFAPTVYWVEKDGSNWNRLVGKLRTYIEDKH